MTIRAAARTAPFVEPTLNEDTVRTLLAERLRSECALYAYCLMPDHLHVLVAPRRADVSALDFVRRFKGRSTRCAWQHGIVGRLWQPRHYDRVLRVEEAVVHVAEYIAANPVRRGLVTHASKYRWTGFPDPL